jgi:beta-lactamase regulating signal transducer with metallopeptidase domain
MTLREFPFAAGIQNGNASPQLKKSVKINQGFFHRVILLKNKNSHKERIFVAITMISVSIIAARPIFGTK